MNKEHTFFELNLKPFVKELENASHALNSFCEEIEEGMCFLLKGTLDRIARDLEEKIDCWEKEFTVYKKTDQS